MTVQIERAARNSFHVATLAEARLMSSSHPPLRRIFCEYDGGVLVLHGRLNSFFHKQLAQETVARIEGVERVVNKIEVVNGAMQRAKT
jgi:osmotically-inducible protein OsmY